MRAVLRWSLLAAGVCQWATILFVCLSSAGCCRVLGLAYRTTRGEPSVYCDNCDRRRSLALYSTWAEEAWIQEASNCNAAASPDYIAGFHDGFVDYVYAGGTGEPPPVPPRRYWNVGLRLPAGKALANDWFAGFRHGARVARDGGYRELGTVRGMLGGYPRSPQRSESYLTPKENSTAPVGPTNPFSSEDPIEPLPDPATTRDAEGPTMLPPNARQDILPPQLPAKDSTFQEEPSANDDESEPSPQSLPPANDSSTNSPHNTNTQEQLPVTPAPAELELPQVGKLSQPISSADQGWKSVTQTSECAHTLVMAVNANPTGEARETGAALPCASDRRARTGNTLVFKR